VRQVGIRLLQLVPVLFLVSVATFLMVDLLPGDPAIAIVGENATPDQIAAIRHDLHLDDSVVSRYGQWLGDAVQGDLGRSVRSHQTVVQAFRERLPVTLELAVMAQIIALGLAIPTGAWAAWRAGRAFDRATTATSFGFLSLPPFLLGIFLIYLFALRFSWFPVTQWVRLTEDFSGNLKHALLPALSLALGESAIYSQLLRSDMAAVLQEDYVLAAKARGLPTRHILLREALRPSSFSLVTLAGVNLGRLIGGTLIIEQVFALPGVGRLIFQAIPQRDMPVLQGSVLILAVAYLLINTVVDLSYGLLDPRVRRGRH
jgi:peptide/nickel transport system permease protein